MKFASIYKFIVEVVMIHSAKISSSDIYALDIFMGLEVNVLEEKCVTIKSLSSHHLPICAKCSFANQICAANAQRKKKTKAVAGCIVQLWRYGTFVQ